MNGEYPLRITRVANSEFAPIDPATETTLQNIYEVERLQRRLNYQAVNIVIPELSNAEIGNPENMFDSDPNTYATITLPSKSVIQIWLNEPQSVDNVILLIDNTSALGGVTFGIHYADGSVSGGNLKGITDKTVFITVDQTRQLAYFTLYNGSTSNRTFNVYEMLIYPTQKIPKLNLLDTNNHLINPATWDMQRTINASILQLYRYKALTVIATSGSSVNNLTNMLDGNTSTSGGLSIAAGGKIFFKFKYPILVSNITMDTHANSAGAGELEYTVTYVDGSVESGKVLFVPDFGLSILTDPNREVSEFVIINPTSSAIDIVIYELYIYRMFARPTLSKYQRDLSAGISFKSSIMENVASGNTLSLYINPNGANMHLYKLILISKAELSVTVYKNPTITADGTAINTTPLNDNTATSLTISNYVYPSWSATGDIEQTTLVPPYTRESAIPEAVITDPRLILITNNSANAEDVYIILIFAQGA